MFTELKAFKCNKCKKVFMGEAPPKCTCQTEYKEGTQVGVFHLQEKLEDRNWKVTCLLCGIDTKIHATNLKKQKTCGCKPRHITLLDSSGDEVRYRCRTCGTTHVDEMPVFVWCCTDGE